MRRRYLPAALIVAILLPVYLSLPIHESDHPIFWYVGRITLAGGTPYDNVQWSSAPAEFPGIHDMVALYPTRIWAYPPWVAYLHVPEALLPLEAGVFLQGLIYLMLGLASGLGVISGVRWRTPVAPGLALALVAVFEPFVHSVRGGEHGPLILAGVMLAVWGLRRSVGVAIAVGLILALIKPHLSYAFAILIVAELVERRAWRTAAIAAATALGIFGVTWWGNPDAVFSMAVGGGDRLPLAVSNATTWSFASGFTPTLWPLLGLGLIGVAVVACWIALRSAPADLRFWTLVSVSLVLSAVTTPYANPYDHYLLVVALVLCVALADRADGAVRPLALAVVVVIGAAGAWVAFFAGVGLGGQYGVTGAVPILFALMLAMCAAVARQGAGMPSGSSWAAAASRAD